VTVVVPLIDLSAARSGPDARFGEALVESGFVVLEGHRIPSALGDRAATAALRAFALAPDVKARYRGPDDGSQRGYLEMRTALRDGRAALDRKECWHARRPGHRFANLFPAEAPELEPALLALIDAFDALAARILAGIDAFLGGTALAASARDGDSVFRLNHYPDLGGSREPRFAAHCDFDLITFLLGATAPGLEIEARDGHWHALTPSASSIVVSAGDLLQVASGGRIPSARHRVVTPTSPDGGRLSMVYFVAPRPDLVLAEGIVSGDVVDRRLREAGYLR